MAVSERELQVIEAQLGRPPRGVRAVETRCPASHPQVIRVYPLIDGEPFPTLFWLTCPELVRRISRLEARGVIAQLESVVRRDPRFRARYLRDHRAYAAERWRELIPRDRRWIRAQGLLETFRKRGIGGLEDRTQVKCLHMHYAHHLARGSVIGWWLVARFDLSPCGADQDSCPVRSP